jgi:hypothetical protein
VSLSHGYRKFFRTQLDTAKVPVAVAEQMVGHDRSLIGTYARHALEQLRAYYMEAAEGVTFFVERRRLPASKC